MTCLAQADTAPPTLSGIMIVAGRERLAILTPAGTRNPVVVREGDSVGGWRVLGIAPDQVLAQGPGGTVTLEFDGSRSEPQPEPPREAPPAPRRAGPGEKPGPGEQDE